MRNKFNPHNSRGKQQDEEENMPESSSSRAGELDMLANHPQLLIHQVVPTVLFQSPQMCRWLTFSGTGWRVGRGGVEAE